MAKHEFRFIVTDVELSTEHEQRISRAVAQAAALALAEVTPANAVTVPLGRNIWWRGIPQPELLKALEQYAQGRVGGV